MGPIFSKLGALILSDFSVGPIVATNRVNFLEILCGAFFCRKTFCGRHTISFVEDLASQANQLLNFHRAVPAPSHTTGDRALPNYVRFRGYPGADLSHLKV